MYDPFNDTLILSDLHLGSEVSRARDALRLLKHAHFRRLILLGDIFCDLDFGRLKKDHWQFLSYIRKLSNPKRNVEVVWVEGNHDKGLTTVMSHLVGMRVYQRYAWEYRGMRHIAVHGHQFDRFVIDNALVSAVGSQVYLYLQKLDSSSKRFSRFLDRLNSSWLRLSAKVAAGAVDLAREHGAQRVFCGHTHEPLERQQDGIHYVNTGCWTNQTPTYVAIGEFGVSLRKFPISDEPAGVGIADELEPVESRTA